MSKSVTVVDYGMGNVLSVRRAFESIGAKVILTDNLGEIGNAGYLVLPGVGAFGNCMQELEKRHLIDAIREFIKSGNPMLGICVGMQVLMDESEEYGTHPGIGVIPGRVEQIPSLGLDGNSHNIPHIGWTEIHPSNSGRDNDASWGNSILATIPAATPFYFVHSFTAIPEDRKYRLADSFYGGQLVSAAVSIQNVTGLQFHPEKSGAEGLKVLTNFMMK